MIALPFPAGWTELATAYAPRVRAALTESILPFWARAVDAERGGVFSCWNNAGTQLVSRDKFTWSQGRFAWMCARLAEAVNRGLLPGDSIALLHQARQTVEFLQQHAAQPDGRWAFRLTEEGRPQEAFPGSGLAPSIYADCFVAMGCAELARMSGDRALLDEAHRLVESIGQIMNSPEIPTWPTPIPAGYAAYAPPMIFLNISLTLERAHAALGGARKATAQAWCRQTAAKIFERFADTQGRVHEFRPGPGVPSTEDALLSRLTNPGHTLEGAWMLFTVAEREQRRDWMEATAQIVRSAFERGWDREFGGLFYYVDLDGGKPHGAVGETAYEKGVLASWDTKLWWPHVEALVAALASYRLTGDPVARDWFERTFEYVFRVFPNPDTRVGEWIQIRDRRGAPLDRVVALPVKDPYHITRNLLQLLELFDGSTAIPHA